MYVCICGAVTENDIKQAVKDGCTCLCEVQRALPAALNCTQCKCQIEEIIEETLELTLA